MHDFAGMRGFQRVGYLGADRKKLRHRHRLTSQARFERLAFDVFHGEKVRSSGLADFVNVRRVGMAQGRSEARFLQESGEPVSVRGDLR
jgi:hypothetical protein